MTSDRFLSTTPPPIQTRVESEEVIVEPGQWYWILKGDNDDEWFACAKKVGSNFVEFHAAEGGYTRIHVDNLFDRVRREPNPEKVFADKLADLKVRLASQIAQIQATMARLSLSKDAQLSTSTALVAMSGQTDLEKYELALKEARDTELPALFESLRSTHKSMERLVKARLIPIESKIEEMTEVVDHVKGRLFSLSLYAGFSERVKQIKDGKPAKIDEVLRIMQRRLYMDEEALVGYEHGGMEFSDIKAFDRWLGKKKNMERLLPFERCVAAFRVRRHAKDRSELKNPFLRIALEEEDELTFLYIRNGGRLFRINTKLKFGHLLFPNRGEFSLDDNEPLMVKDSRGSSSHDDEIETMPRKSWELSKAEEEERRRKSEEWDEQNPREEWEARELERLKKAWAEDPEAARRKQNRGILCGGRNEPHVYGWEWEKANPFGNVSRTRGFDFEAWHPLDASYVYFDECMKGLKKRVEYYNRIAYIVQGLFDRSAVFDPHLPVNLASPAGVIELIYDQQTLFDGQRPDFEEYRRKLGEAITKDSTLFGQEQIWEEQEGKKESGRRRSESVKHFRPHGNPGPGRLAKPEKLKKNGDAVFAWYRQRQTPVTRRLFMPQRERIRCTLSVPLDKLFNMSAYQAGDYLQFFRDPRTRAEYMKWAEILLTAEEFAAGNLKAQERTWT